MEVVELSQKVEQREIGNSLTLLWGTWELWCDVTPSSEQEKFTAETSPLCAESTFTQGQTRNQAICNKTYNNNKKINDIHNDYNANMFTKNEISKNNNTNSSNTNQYKVENWLDRVRSIGLFDSAEGFWGLHDCIVEPSQLPIGTSYYLFRKHVAPMWEHEANRRGGKWVITFTQPFPPFSSCSSSSVLHSNNLNLFEAFASSRAKSSQHSCNQNKCNDSTKENSKLTLTSSVPRETALSAKNMRTATSPLSAEQIQINNINNNQNSNVDSGNMNTETNHSHLQNETNMMPVDVAWERLCLAVIGELLPCDEEEICGIVVSRNKPKSTAFNNSHFTSYSKNGIMNNTNNSNSNSAGEWKLSLWTRTADDEETQMQIVAYVAKLLSFDPSCQYNNTTVTNKDNNGNINEIKADVVDAIDNRQQSISDTLPYSATRQGKNSQSMLPSTLFTGILSYVVHRELMLAKQQTNKINYAQPYVFKPRYTYLPTR